MKKRILTTLAILCAGMMTYAASPEIPATAASKGDTLKKPEATKDIGPAKELRLTLDHAWTKEGSISYLADEGKSELLVTGITLGDNIEVTYFAFIGKDLNISMKKPNGDVEKTTIPTSRLKMELLAGTNLPKNYIVDAQMLPQQKEDPAKTSGQIKTSAIGASISTPSS